MPLRLVCQESDNNGNQLVLFTIRKKLLFRYVGGSNKTIVLTKYYTQPEYFQSPAFRRTRIILENFLQN